MIYVASLEVNNDELIKGNRCCTSPKDLFEAIIQNDTTEIRIQREFYEKFYTPSGLADFIKNVHELNPSIRIITDFQLPRDEETSVKRLRNLDNVNELVYAIETQPEETISLIKMLCDNYLGIYNETLIANNRVSSLHMQNSRLLKEIDERKKRYDEVVNERNDSNTRLHQLISRINYSYDKHIDGDMLLSVDGCKYDKVLYIKEVTRVHYTDTFVYYLQEILKTLYGVPARLLVIEPYYAYERARLYPGLKPHWDLSYRDVYEGDVFMAGFQPNLARDIMQNGSAFNYLIVVDRGGYAKPHLVHEKVEVLWEASRVEDLPEGIDNSRVITYEPGHLSIDYIDNFDNLSAEDKIHHYSSMPMMHSVIELMERR